MAGIHDRAPRCPVRVVRSRPKPTSSRATVSIGRSVADRPTRCTGSATTCASRSRVRARCEPRLSGHRVDLVHDHRPDGARHGPAPLRRHHQDSDSGVVIRMSGGCLSMAARSAAAVSPVLTATAIGRRGQPGPAADTISRSGASRFCWMSVASAFERRHVHHLRPARGRCQSVGWAPFVPAEKVVVTGRIVGAVEPVDADRGRREGLAQPGRRRDRRWRPAAISASPRPAARSARPGTGPRTRHARRDETTRHAPHATCERRHSSR